MVRLAICAPIFLVTCAHISPDRDPLSQVWVAPRPMGVVRNCIVKALDKNGRTYSKISPSVRHVAKTLIPNSEVEIRPVNEHALADVDYYVRLEKIHDVITRIAFHSAEDSKSRRKTAEAIAPCGSTP
jgi:hypothetical protein